MGQSCRYTSCMSRGMRDDFPFALSRASAEQRFGLLEISGVKALGEPAVERYQQVIGCLALALRRPQFPGCGSLADIARISTGGNDRYDYGLRMMVTNKQGVTPGWTLAVGNGKSAESLRDSAMFVSLSRLLSLSPQSSC